MEADGIDALTGTRRLRAHVVGDCDTPAAASLVGMALVRHHAKHNQRSWTYTHSWRDVPIFAWMGARVLASCENIHDLRLAEKRLYAQTLLIPPTTSRKAYAFHEYTVVPCPAQFHQPNGVRQTTCSRCNICSDTFRNWFKKRVVGFQPDGQTGPRVSQGRLF